MNQQKLLRIIKKAARDGWTELELGLRNLTSLPRAIGQLKNLTTLRLQNNKLTSVPGEIGQLKNLTELDLSANNLASLPAEIAQLKNLTELDLSGNKLTSLPAEIAQLKNLRVLVLVGNNLTSMPTEIGQLNNLAGLYLPENDLTSLPAEIGQLKDLTRLYLHDNNLTSLPAEIGQLEMLDRLYLHGNDGLGIPPEVLGPTYGEAGKPARPADIIEYYFRQRREARRELREAKVLLVGQGGVGKTSLVKRLIDDDYSPAELKTEGIDIRDWEVAGKRRAGKKTPRIKLNVWDFGGQEIMHATHQFFLTKRSLYILVLDARKGENECNIHYWLKIIQSYGGESPVLVVTNQCDQDVLELNENRLTKDYSPNIKGFFATSCKTGKGTKELAAAIEKEISELEHVYDVLPKSYFDIKQRLEQLAESKNFIDLTDYRELCNEHDVTKEEEQNLLLRFLHDLGNVLNFGDPKDPYKLRDTNILNPEWVTEGVYKIINNKQLREQKEGILRWSKIGGILDDRQKYPVGRHGFIINMMRKFELCFDFPDRRGKRVLIPELLGKNEPNIEWDHGNSLNFEYHYSVLPSGLICRFIVRMHAKVTRHHVYWRSGVLMEIGQNMALVRGDTDKGRVYISVAGAEKGRRDALRVIRDEFKAIHATVPRLDVKQKVPLADEEGVEGVEGVVVDYAHLVKLEKAGQADYWPEGAQKSYKVKELLEGVDVRRFDVFLCHNSQDKAAVEKIAKRLLKVGLRPWFDKWNLSPGDTVSDALEKAIKTIPCAMLCFGPADVGNWHIMEIRAYVEKWASGNARMIPVILPGVHETPELPLFVRQTLWVDMRDWEKDDSDGFYRLVCGILRRPPGDSPPKRFGARDVAEWQAMVSHY